MKSAWVMTFFAFLIASPLMASGRNVWFEIGGGPWLPMFGSFKNDHDPGVQGRLRIGYDGQFTLSSSLKKWFPPLALFNNVYPFAEVYHSYNRLKTPVNGVNYGNVAFIGIGGRLLNSYRNLRYGAHLSIGFLSFYTLNRYSPAGFVGLYGQWNLRRFYLYAEYNLETSVNLQSSYSIDTSLTFLQRSSGWHEIGLGVGFRLGR